MSSTCSSYTPYSVDGSGNTTKGSFLYYLYLDYSYCLTSLYSARYGLGRGLLIYFLFLGGSALGVSFSFSDFCSAIIESFSLMRFKSFKELSSLGTLGIFYLRFLLSDFCCSPQKLFVLIFLGRPLDFLIDLCYPSIDGFTSYFYWISWPYSYFFYAASSIFFSFLCDFTFLSFFYISSPFF